MRKNDQRGLKPTTMATSSTATKNSSDSFITFAAVTPSITASPYHVPTNIPTPSAANNAPNSR